MLTTLRLRLRIKLRLRLRLRVKLDFFPRGIHQGWMAYIGHEWHTAGMDGIQRR